MLPASVNRRPCGGQEKPPRRAQQPQKVRDKGRSLQTGEAQKAPFVQGAPRLASVAKAREETSPWAARLAWLCLPALHALSSVQQREQTHCPGPCR